MTLFTFHTGQIKSLSLIHKKQSGLYLHSTLVRLKDKTLTLEENSHFGFTFHTGQIKSWDGKE